MADDQLVLDDVACAWCGQPAPYAFRLCHLCFTWEVRAREAHGDVTLAHLVGHDAPLIAQHPAQEAHE